MLSESCSASLRFGVQTVYPQQNLCAVGLPLMGDVLLYAILVLLVAYS